MRMTGLTAMEAFESYASAFSPAKGRFDFSSLPRVRSEMACDLFPGRSHRQRGLRVEGIARFAPYRLSSAARQRAQPRFHHPSENSWTRLAASAQLSNQGRCNDRHEPLGE